MVACLCETIEQVANRTFVRVIQHPRERTHPFGTVRLVRLGLLHRAICVADRGPHGRAITPPCDDVDALLFPGPNAPALESMAAVERPRSLLVVDGTWPQARNLIRYNPWIAALPRVSLLPAAPSRYRIRRACHRAQLSTIEAIVAALQVLEPDTTGLGGLLRAFDSMIDQQLYLSATRTQRNTNKLDVVPA